MRQGIAFDLHGLLC